mgnify:FL=1
MMLSGLPDNFFSSSEGLLSGLENIAIVDPKGILSTVRNKDGTVSIDFGPAAQEHNNPEMFDPPRRMRGAVVVYPRTQ